MMRLLVVYEVAHGGMGLSSGGKVFEEVIRDIKLFSSKADSTLDTLTKADSNWFVGTFMKMIR